MADTYNTLVFWGFQTHVVGMSGYDFASDGVILAMIAVL